MNKLSKLIRLSASFVHKYFFFNTNPIFTNKSARKVQVILILRINIIITRLPLLWFSMFFLWHGFSKQIEFFSEIQALISLKWMVIHL